MLGSSLELVAEIPECRDLIRPEPFERLRELPAAMGRAERRHSPLVPPRVVFRPPHTPPRGQRVVDGEPGFLVLVGNRAGLLGAAGYADSASFGRRRSSSPARRVQAGTS